MIIDTLKILPAICSGNEHYAIAIGFCLAGGSFCPGQKASTVVHDPDSYLCPADINGANYGH